MPDYVSLLFLMASLFAGSAAAMLHKKRQMRLEHLRGQLHGIAITGALKKLLTQIQQHRGMVSAYLNGDQSFKYKIPALQADIGRQLELIAGQLKHSPPHIPAFSGIDGGWRRLYPSMPNLTKEESFEQHCLLIGSILNLIGDIAEHSQLHRESICPFGLIEILWHLLPDTAEAIGQARAIGTGIAAAGHCQIIERIKLGYLVTRIRQTSVRVENGMAGTQTALAANHDFRLAYAAVRANIANLIGHIEGQLLAADKPAVDPSSFFDNATGTLNGVFGLYDQGEAITNQALQSQLAVARRLGKQSLGAVMAALVVAMISLARFGQNFT